MPTSDKVLYAPIKNERGVPGMQSCVVAVAGYKARCAGPPPSCRRAGRLLGRGLAPISVGLRVCGGRGFQLEGSGGLRARVAR